MPRWLHRLLTVLVTTTLTVGPAPVRFAAAPPVPRAAPATQAPQPSPCCCPLCAQPGHCCCEPTPATPSSMPVEDGGQAPAKLPDEQSPPRVPGCPAGCPCCIPTPVFCMLPILETPAASLSPGEQVIDARCTPHTRPNDRPFHPPRCGADPAAFCHFAA